MAKVFKLITCRYCGAELSDESTARCPSCKRTLSGPEGPFKQPRYLSRQRLELLEARMREDPKGVRNLAQFEQSLIDALHAWARGCTSEDRHDALLDAQLVMQNLMHSSTPLSDMKAIVKMGKAIGKLAEILDAYFTAGGLVYDREAGQVRPGPVSDRGGEEPTA